MEISSLSDRWQHWGPRVVWALCAGVVLLYGLLWMRLPEESDPAQANPGPITWPDPAEPAPDSWSVFRGGDPAAETSAPSGLASRYRLAGTFSMLAGDEEGSGVRKAVLDDLETKRQQMVAEGEMFDGIQVVEISSDHVVLRFRSQEETLWLSFAGSPASGATAGAGEPERELRWDERVIESNKWGNRISDNRWILKRDELVRYYQEVIEDPERLAKLFISMKPVRSKKQGNQVTGYVLRPQGEEEFYFGVGLKEGDIVRKVNSMKMTKQERAEYFIAEFVRNRLNAVVFDIERDGKEEQLIYYIR